MSRWVATSAKALVGAFALLAVGWALLVPLHEYGHCLIGWATGRVQTVCHVEFVRHPNGMGLHDSTDETYPAEMGGMPWWEHPLIYGTSAALFLFASWRVSVWVFHQTGSRANGGSNNV